MKRIGAFVLIGCLLLSLCACESSEERERREIEKLMEKIERNKQQSEKMGRDLGEFADIINDIMNGK